MKSDVPKGQRKKGRTVNVAWILTIFALTIVISGIFSIISNTLLSEAGLISAFLILLVIILIGIIFDVVGVAVTAADARPFHSMAARRVKGAQEALSMLRHAEKVSSFCNDVIGDICGVISGTASASIAALVIANVVSAPKALTVLLAALVSGLTVGGKAWGKTLAMARSTEIVHGAATVVYFVKYMPRRIAKAVRRARKNREKHNDNT